MTPRPQDPPSLHLHGGSCHAGQFLAAWSARGLCWLSLGDQPEPLRSGFLAAHPHALTLEADPDDPRVRSLLRYLDSPAATWPDPLDLSGTPFQQLVWNELRRIPPGETRSYAELAAAVGRPSATRATASACAANRIALVIPCHRVIRGDGSPSGFRWGPERKQRLLENEKRSKKV